MDPDERRGVTPLRPLALAALLALTVVSLLVTACGSGIADAIGAARELIAGVVSPSEPAPAGVSPGSLEVQALIATLRGLRVADRDPGAEYNRDDWRHWVDADGDCQNTRAEVLIAESLAPVSFAPRDDGDRCRVVAGHWVGPWTGEVFTDASDVDIDHHVPLGHAHESGGWRWSSDRKRTYANDLADPASLQATSAPVNRSKGKQPPDEWRPDKTASWCRYAADWITVKETWELTVTASEIRALEDMLATCDRASSWGLSGPADR